MCVSFVRIVLFVECMSFLWCWFFFDGFQCVTRSCVLWVSDHLYLGVNLILSLCFLVMFVNVFGEVGVGLFVLLLFVGFMESFVYVVSGLSVLFLFLVV